MSAVGTSIVTPGSMQLSPARVAFDSNDLGGTLNNVVLNWEVTKAEIKADQFGAGTVLDRRNSGMLVTVTTSITEIQDLDKLVAVFPTARDTTVGPDRVLDFLAVVGCADLSLAKTLVLHPLEIPDATKDFDLSFTKATPSESSELVFSPDGQASLNIVWNIYPDTALDNTWFRIGDLAVIVP